MSSRSSNLARICLESSARTSDADGKVSIPDLLDIFKVQVVFRPLLVEAMLCEPNDRSKYDWCILVNSEKYNPSMLDMFNDAKRFRNTIAHELVHAICFRASVSGVKDSRGAQVSLNDKDYLDEIEREAEQFSPLLLLPFKAVKKIKMDFLINDICDICSFYGVSRHVLIQRLALAKRLLEIDELPSLYDLIIGVCDGKRFLNRPVFSVFERNYHPELIYQLTENQQINISNVIPGFDGKRSSEYVSRKLYFGTNKNRREFIKRLVFSFEEGKGERFFMARVASESQLPDQPELF